MMLAKKLGSSMKLSAPKRLAFILGNIAPDINPFSYLIRSGSNNLGGHNYDSRKKYMIHMWKKQEKNRHIPDWFRTGEMLHYLVDSFTRPHNKEFPYPVREHVAYEHELHQHFSQVILSDTVKQLELSAPYIDNFEEWLENSHSEYLTQTYNIEDDCTYILQAYCSVCKTLAAQVPADATNQTPYAMPGQKYRPGAAGYHPQPTILGMPQSPVLARPQPDTAM